MLSKPSVNFHKVYEALNDSFLKRQSKDERNLNSNSARPSISKKMTLKPDAKKEFKESKTMPDVDEKVINEQFIKANNQKRRETIQKTEFDKINENFFPSK